jgi:hypothetical protein
VDVQRKPSRENGGEGEGRRQDAKSQDVTQRDATSRVAPSHITLSPLPSSCLYSPRHWVFCLHSAQLYICMDFKLWLIVFLLLWTVSPLGMPHYPCGRSGCDNIFQSKSQLTRHQNMGLCAGLQSIASIRTSSSRPTKRLRLGKELSHIDEVAYQSDVSGVNSCSCI